MLPLVYVDRVYSSKYVAGVVSVVGSFKFDASFPPVQKNLGYNVYTTCSEVAVWFMF